jgi:hypothetical protein
MTGADTGMGVEGWREISLRLSLTSIPALCNQLTSTSK